MQSNKVTHRGKTIRVGDVVLAGGQLEHGIIVEACFQEQERFFVAGVQILILEQITDHCATYKKSYQWKLLRVEVVEVAALWKCRGEYLQVIAK